MTDPNDIYDDMYDPIQNSPDHNKNIQTQTTFPHFSWPHKHTNINPHVTASSNPPIMTNANPNMNYRSNVNSVHHQQGPPITNTIYHSHESLNASSLNRPFCSPRHQPQIGIEISLSPTRIHIQQAFLYIR